MEPPETNFMMTLGSILESLWEPSLLTYRSLVAPVANAGMFFQIGVRARFLVRKVTSKSREMDVNVGRW